MSHGNHIYGIMLLGALFMQGCSPADKSSEQPVACTKSWYEYVETKLSTGDGRGHGPDPGSDEWKSVVEFRLSIRGNSGMPDRSSPDWCEFIDQHISSIDSMISLEGQ